DNSLSMGDEHLDTISATKSDEFIKSGVEDLIPILKFSSTDDDSFSFDKIDYVEASPPDSELVSSEVMEIVTPEVGGIKASNDNPILFYDPIIFGTPSNLTPSGESDFFLEVEASSTDDDSFSFDKIDYVKASPPDSELVSSEVMEIVTPEVGGIKASNDNSILFYDPIISVTPPNLNPSGESDFFLEVDAFLVVEDEPTSSQFLKSYLDPEGDMLLFKAFLSDDHSSDFKTKSSSTSLNSLLEETNKFNNSLPEFTTFSKVLFDAECESDSNEFAGELTLLKLISPGSDETDCDFEEDIRLIEKLLYDNSSPRPPEEFVSADSDAASESFSPSTILDKDSDSLMEEIDLFCTPDYPM
nr:hypothetical protein [Tanacetum cinerariifolium]